MSLPRVCLSLADHRKKEDASSSSSPLNNILRRLPPPGGPNREAAVWSMNVCLSMEGLIHELLVSAV